MAQNFADLYNKIPRERRERIEDRAGFISTQIALQDIRKQRQLTQQQVASNLGVSQSALSKMEHQQDMKVNTLKRVLRAMGGELKLVASFPDGDVIIGQPEK